MNYFYAKQRRGITVIETLIYVAILAIVLVIVMQSMISIIKTHRIVKLKQSIEASGVISLERILRETRNAASIDIANSVLGSSPGKLVLEGIDSSGPYTLVFDVSDGIIRISKNGEIPGALSVSGINVDSLIFRNVSNSVTDGVKVELSLSGAVGVEGRNLDLFGFSILRNSY